MAYSVNIECPGPPRMEVFEALIEAVTTANTQWFLDEWEAGRDPHCCCKCAGVKYRPNPPSSSARVRGAPAVFASGYASCDEAAAVSAGHARAKEIWDRGVSHARAAARNFVELEDGYHPKARPGEPYWHAYCVTPKGRKDPSATMERV